jgi:GGDEF domain-containing protein
MRLGRAGYRSRRGRRDREDQAHRRTLADGAVNLKPSTVSLSHAVDHRETETSPVFQQQLDAANALPGRRYRLSFSVGVVTADPGKWLTLEDLVAEADAMMYRQKHRKKITDDD